MNDSESVVYESQAHTSLHPSYFSTVAHFLGFESKPMQTARILELGCSTGANLIPIAVDHPETQCLGIDLSEEAVSWGNRSIAELNLSNVELRAQDLTEAENRLGEFDYIIAHGLYSWTPPEVQKKMWKICADSLAPNGVIYVSYNIYPGWHFKTCTRDMVRFMTTDVVDPAERIKQGRGFMDFMAEMSGGYQNHYGPYIRESTEYINRIEEEHFFWEYIGPYNTPVYFHQFMEEAAGYNFGYIGDSNVSRGVIENFPPKVVTTLKSMSGDLIRMEQAIDFIRNGEMRRSLLCHADVTPNRQPNPARLKSYYMLSSLRPENANTDLLQNTAMLFKNTKGVGFSIDNPLTKAVLLEMIYAEPVTLSFVEALEKAVVRLGWTNEQAPLGRERVWWEDALANDLCWLYLADTLKFRRDRANVTNVISDRPVAAPFARVQAAHQERVANQHHRSVNINRAERQILRLMDGSKSVSDLGDALPPEDRHLLDGILGKLAGSALLIA